jgi:hypothetical protein
VTSEELSRPFTKHSIVLAEHTVAGILARTALPLLPVVVRPPTLGEPELTKRHNGALRSPVPRANP